MSNHKLYIQYKYRYGIFKNKLASIPENHEMSEFHDFSEIYLRRYKEKYRENRENKSMKNNKFLKKF